jgi:hypothetical protein
MYRLMWKCGFFCWVLGGLIFFALSKGWLKEQTGPYIGFLAGALMYGGTLAWSISAIATYRQSIRLSRERERVFFSSVTVAPLRQAA